MIAKILIDALRGISTCATKCGCCEMHRSIATDALERYSAEMHRDGCTLETLAQHARDIVDRKLP